MNTNATLEQMKELRLTGMAITYAQQLELPIHQQLEAHELIAQLLKSEQLNRAQEKSTYYLKLAKLRLNAIPEQINCSVARNLSKQQLATLLDGQYMKDGENILITGATGCLFYLGEIPGEITHLVCKRWVIGGISRLKNTLMKTSTIEVDPEESLVLTF